MLDYGILSDADESIKTFAIHNHNPVTIQITSYTVSVGLPHTTVELVSIYPTDPSSKSAGGRRMFFKSSKPPFDMEPGYSALFRVNVSHPQNLGAFSGEILVHTSFERVVHIPVFYRTAPGGLKVTPERIDFGSMFPYSTSEVPVNVSNYYRNAVSVTAIKSVPKDLRLFIRPAGDHKHFPRLKPAEVTQVRYTIQLTLYYRLILLLSCTHTCTYVHSNVHLVILGRQLFIFEFTYMYLL